MSALTSERLFTSREIARMLGVDIETVQRWARRGRLRAVRVGEQGRYRFPESEIVRLFSERTEEAAA